MYRIREILKNDNIFATDLDEAVLRGRDDLPRLAREIHAGNPTYELDFAAMQVYSDYFEALIELEIEIGNCVSKPKCGLVVGKINLHMRSCCW